jgi:hypothetical protein
MTIGLNWTKGLYVIDSQCVVKIKKQYIRGVLLKICKKCFVVLTE